MQPFTQIFWTIFSYFHCRGRLAANSLIACCFPFQFIDHLGGRSAPSQRSNGEVQVFAAKQESAGRQDEYEPLWHRIHTGIQSSPAVWVPRTIESSISSSFCPAIRSCTGISFILANQVTLALIGRHEGTGPGRRILDKRRENGIPDSSHNRLRALYPNREYLQRYPAGHRPVWPAAGRSYTASSQR